MQTDAEVAAIARQMSRKVRQVIMTTGDGEQRPYTDIPQPVRVAIFRTDAVEYVPRSDPPRFRLTKFGSRVAQHLKQENAK